MTIRNVLIDLLKRTHFAMVARDIAGLLTAKGRAYRATERADLAQLVAQVGDLLQHPLYDTSGTPRTVLIMGMGRVRFVAQEAVVRKSFERAGFRCAVLLPQDRMVVSAYQRLGSDRVVFFDRFRAPEQRDGARLLDGCKTLNDVTAISVDGVRCGKYAVSTLMRQTRTGTFDLDLPSTRAALVSALNWSLRCVRTARALLDEIKPDALVLLDRGYSPSGELFDHCIGSGIPVFTWNAAHKNDTLMLKRYSEANRDVHPSSLSSDTWRDLLRMEWTPQHWETLRRELEDCYGSGQWYAEVGTQFNKKALDRRHVLERLGVDPAKKTAVIFPHIFWDATFFWGEDLFENYEDWFIHTVRGACANDRLDWIIKVHPANLVKNRRDGVTDEHSEIVAIRNAVGELPDHVKLLPADTDISTLSLFPAIDCCVTVRGTVGIEAACFGVPVLTAGTGRFDHLGFTLDSDSREAYLQRLASAETLEPLGDGETELARRYAWEVLIRRPARLRMMKMRYQVNDTADLEVDFEVHSVAELAASPDIQSVAEWIASGAEDYVHPAGA